MSAYPPQEIIKDRELFEVLKHVRVVILDAREAVRDTLTSSARTHGQTVELAGWLDRLDIWEEDLLYATDALIGRKADEGL